MFLFRMVLVPLPFNVKPSMEIYLRYLEKFGSGICTFECHDKNGATKRLKSGKTVGIINKQLVKAPIIGYDFHLGNVENTLVLSQLNDEILQRCDKEVIDDSLFDVPVDAMVEEVASDFIPNSVMAIPL